MSARRARCGRLNLNGLSHFRLARAKAQCETYPARCPAIHADLARYPFGPAAVRPALAGAVEFARTDLYPPDDNFASFDLTSAGTDSGLDARIQAALDQTRPNPNAPSVAVLEPLFALVHQHPDLIWLKADMLRTAMRGGMRLPFDPRIYPPSDYVDFQPPRWLQPELELRTAQLAETGARQDPANAYFPLMAAALWFDLHREPAGWAALARAANCPHFNDYTLTEAQRRCEILERKGPLSWQRRWMVTEAILLPHLSPLHAMALFITYRAAQAREAGNNELAWQRYEAGLTLGRALRRDPNYYVQALVGDEIEDHVWLAALGREKHESMPKGEVQASAYHVGAAPGYAALIRTWDAPESVARKSRGDARNFLSLRFGGSTRCPFTPVPLSRLQEAYQGDWLACWFARLAWLGAILWLAGGLASRAGLKFPRSRAGWPASSSKKLPEPWAIRACTALAVAGILVAECGCLWIGAGDRLGAVWEIPEYPGIQRVQFAEMAFLNLVVAMWLMAPLLWWLPRVRRLVATTGGRGTAFSKMRGVRGSGGFGRNALWILGFVLAAFSALKFEPAADPVQDTL